MGLVHLTRVKNRLYFVVGVIVCAASANPLFYSLEEASAPLKVTVDSMLLFGGALVGYAVFHYLQSTATEERRMLSGFVRSLRFLGGVFYVWVIPATVVAAWYTPSLLTFGFTNAAGALLEVVSMAFAGVLAGAGWHAMGKIMKSATLFMVFFMSATMGELLTEEGGVNVFFPGNYPYYTQTQLLYTGYIMWLISLVPVTFYAVKFLKDMGMF
jgi:hypothetical protein